MERKQYDGTRVLTVALLTAVVVSTTMLCLYRHVLARYLQMENTLNWEMKDVGEAVGTGCAFAAGLLVWIGIAELVRRRWRQAVWNFVFAFAAFNCWVLALSMTVRVK